MTGKIAQASELRRLLRVVARSARPRVAGPAEELGRTETTPLLARISVTVGPGRCRAPAGRSLGELEAEEPCGSQLESGRPSIAASASIPPATQPGSRAR